MSCVLHGITDSAIYLQEALQYLNETITHVSISIECKTPKITPKITEMRNSIALLLGVSPHMIGITATSGEELTEFGRGNGINVFTCITVE